MAKKCPECPKCPDCLPDWLAQFGDLMSLLLVFFVLLLSMSVMDDKKIIEYLAHMQASMGIMESSTQSQVARLKDIEKTSEMEDTSDNMEQNMEEITESVLELNQRNQFNKEEINEDMDNEDFAQLELGKEGFIIKLPETLLFEKGEYELKNIENFTLFFQSLSKILKKTPEDLEIEISGYCSPEEKEYLNKYKAPFTLWELGFFRAESIYKEFLKTYIHNNKYNFVLKSFGDTSIKSFKNKDKNSRVEIYLRSKKYKSKLDKEQNTLFDNAEKGKYD